MGGNIGNIGNIGNMVYKFFIGKKYFLIRPTGLLERDRWREIRAITLNDCGTRPTICEMLPHRAEFREHRRKNAVTFTVTLKIRV